MWMADQWQDYELLDCGGGEKLERWGSQILVRPDPQAIWETDHSDRLWQKADARYSRSATGGGRWDKKQVPEQWPIRYGELTFLVKPMNFKHTGLFPEQAANWEFAMDKIKNADRPIRVLNLFAYTGGATVASKPTTTTATSTSPAAKRSSTAAAGATSTRRSTSGHTSLKPRASSIRPWPSVADSSAARTTIPDNGRASRRLRPWILPPAPRSVVSSGPGA